MQVALAAGLLRASRSGRGRYVRKLIEALTAAQGHRLLVLVAQAQDIDPSLSCDWQVLSGPAHLDRWHRSLWQLWPRGKPLPDLLHIPYWMVPKRHPRAVALTVTVHDLIHLDVWRLSAWRRGHVEPRMLAIDHARRWMQEQAWSRQVQGWWAVSQHTAERLAATFGMDPKRIVPGPPPLDPLFAWLPKNSEPVGSSPYWLHFGGTAARKNLPRLLAAIRTLLPAERVPLVILSGDRPKLDPEPTWRWQPGVDDAALCQWIDGAQAVMYPSLAEGYGLPLREAVVRGCPVMASDLPAHREQQLPNSAVSWCDPWRVDSIAQALRDLPVRDAVPRLKVSAESDLRAWGQAHWRWYQETLASLG